MTDKVERSLFAVLIGLASCLFWQGALAVNFPEKPPKSDFFVDQAQLLNEDAQKAINKAALELLNQEQIPLFVVTIPSLSAYEGSALGIEGYATQLFDHWGIGSQERNYGMLLIVSVGDRRARIELGAGFEHRFDAQANDIMKSLIVPAFKRGDFSTGITDGVRGMDAMARGLQLPKPTAPWWFLPAIIGGVIFLGFVIYNLFKTGRSGWAWALIAFIAVALFFILRSAASSGGGFGGGSSGGGGATGSW
ncbi:MAG: TPM domain-containing protein [Acidobacteriota bacterium]|nr:TPM domain-containing protein [Acidobacteriota bacterium]